jgi:hypothetical protein
MLPSSQFGVGGATCPEGRDFLRVAAKIKLEFWYSFATAGTVSVIGGKSFVIRWFALCGRVSNLEPCFLGNSSLAEVSLLFLNSALAHQPPLLLLRTCSGIQLAIKPSVYYRLVRLEGFEPPTCCSGGEWLQVTQSTIPFPPMCLRGFGDSAFARS